MNKHLGFLFILLLLSIESFSQQQDSILNFFFDKNYYLVDEDCEFVLINRIAGFDISNNRFNGPFEDLVDDKIVLTGNYKGGLKDGKFTAYHANQNIRWEVVFKNDYPVEHWRYYYPDGKPLMSINFTDSTTKIEALWDKKGKLKIKSGNGTYEFTNPIPVYSSYGFGFYKIRGKIENGLPSGIFKIWNMNEPNGFLEFSAEEFYKNGLFKSGIDYFNDSDYDISRFQILPLNTFFNAEKLIYQDCTFDDFSGFKRYLSAFFTGVLSSVEKKDLDTVQTFEYQVNISNDGIPRRIKLTKVNGEEKVKNEVINISIGLLDYYPPSYMNEKYISDELSINVSLAWDTEKLAYQAKVIDIYRKAEDKEVQGDENLLENE